MIEVTRLNGGRMAVNEDHIERVEATPDTVIYLTYGTHFVVQEPLEAVVDKITESRAELLRRAGIVVGPTNDPPASGLHLLPLAPREGSERP